MLLERNFRYREYSFELRKPARKDEKKRKPFESDLKSGREWIPRAKHPQVCSQYCCQVIEATKGWLAPYQLRVTLSSETFWKKSLNQNFDKAVNAIVNCQSKIILCGVGKSGIIANKISATLSSIGTPSFSLSANDCSHGDMGCLLYTSDAADE